MTTRATRTPRRRTVIVMALVAIVLIAFTVRLVDIQVVSASDYIDDSRGQIGQSRTITGTRGEIVDAGGNVLAVTTLTYQAAIDPMNMLVRPAGQPTAPLEMPADWPETAEKIGAVIGMAGTDVQALVEQAKQTDPNTRYAFLAGGLSTAQMQALKELGLSYLTFASTANRTYPDGAVAGNLIGYTGVSDDGRGIKPLAGLERMQDACLQETDGSETFLRGTNGEIVPGSLRTTAAVDGGTLQLTIDRDLNWYMQQLITEQTQLQGAKSGSIMVVETATGAIRAAAEYPTVDPNDVGATDAADRGSRLFQNTFEPGSTFKAATAAMLLEAGVIDMHTTVQAPSSWTFPNGARVNDATEHPVNNYTIAGALIDSSNVGVSMFGEYLTPQQRYDYLRAFGVGTKTAVEFEGEQAGLLNAADTWDNQTIYATTFGQAMTVTAPQVASFYQAIANNGVRMPLHLVEGCTAADGTVTDPDLPDPERILSEQTSAQMRTIIENVAEQGGVADLIKVPGYRIAAKTGTAQTLDEVNGGYKAGVYDTSLVGFAPADDPKYVVIVTLKEPTKVTSSTATAPAFQKAMTQVLKTYRVLPSATAFTDILPKTE